jgi:hypothetical protein
MGSTLRTELGSVVRVSTVTVPHRVLLEVVRLGVGVPTSVEFIGYLLGYQALETRGHQVSNLLGLGLHHM